MSNVMKPYRRRIPPSSSPSPLDDDNLLGEIFLRLPLQPSSLPRVSAVSKPWRRLAIDAAFLRGAHHRKPPILGVFQKHGQEMVFTSVLNPPDRIPRERFTLPVCIEGGWHAWRILGCRHGRVLIFSRKHREILVFDPFSGDCTTMAVPPEFVGTVNGAVLCAAGDDDPGHVHGSCHLSPFKVVLVGTRNQHRAIARVYSSKTGIWGELVATPEPCNWFVSRFPGTLVGNALYWWLSQAGGDGILEVDLDSQSLVVMNTPPFKDINIASSRIIRGDDGGVRLAVLLYLNFQLWDRKVNSHGFATWVLHKTFNMHEILDLPSERLVRTASIKAYSEDAEAILLCVVTHEFSRDFFIIRLESMQPMRLHWNFGARSCHLFTKFYTAGSHVFDIIYQANPCSNVLLLRTMYGIEHRSMITRVWATAGALLQTKIKAIAKGV